MSMRETARWLDSAADELAGMRAELASALDCGLDGSGPGAREVAAVLQATWARHVEAAGRLATEVADISASVRLAADRYRAADEGML